MYVVDTCRYNAKSISLNQIEVNTGTHTHTGKATKGKVQDIGEVNKVMPLPLPSSVG